MCSDSVYGNFCVYKLWYIYSGIIFDLYAVYLDKLDKLEHIYLKNTVFRIFGIIIRSEFTDTINESE